MSAEAVAALIAELPDGTVVTDPGSLPVAARELPTEAELADLVDYRCIVEGGAAALAARRITDAQLDHLRALAREMKETEAFREWSEQDTLLHLLIADITGSSRVMVEVGKLRAAVFEISQLVPVAAEVVELANREHDQLIDAISRRDERAATAAMVAHVESTHALWLGLGRVPRELAGRNP